jgi:hypothetical protein
MVGFISGLNYAGLFNSGRSTNGNGFQNYRPLDLSSLSLNQPSVQISTSTAAKAKAAPKAPWDPRATQAGSAALAKAALNGTSVINSQSAQGTSKASTADYGKLLTVYQGISGLTGLATQLQDKTISATERAKIQAAFLKGQADVSTYMDTLKLDKIDLTRGQTLANSRTTNGVPRTKLTYNTAPIFSGTATDVVPAFQGDVQFDLKIKTVNKTSSIHIDLADMGTTTRSMGEVVAFINTKLAAEGLTTRFDKIKTPDVPKTIQSGGKTVSLPAGPDKWSLGIKGVQGEELTFSAPATADAVYLSQKAGIDSKATDATKTVSQQEWLKFQTDQSSTTDSPPDAFKGVGESNYVSGRVFSKQLPPEVTSIASSQTAADGSIYVLANVNGKTGGQAIKGSTDVALLKFDSAGNLVFNRTLGAGDNAKGMTMAISSDGQIAIAGSVTGQLDGVLNPSLKTASTTDLTNGKGADATVADSFVTVFSSAGDELWTRRSGTNAEDEALSVSFGANNTLYVAGRTKGAVAGATNTGGWDSYLRGYSWATTSKQVYGETINPITKVATMGYTTKTTTKVTDSIVKQFGTAGEDKAVATLTDGNAVLVASKESGKAILRRYEIQTDGSALLTSTRDLGDLQGGDITGMGLNGGKLVLVGSTRNGSFSGASITQAAGGGMDAFGLSISKDLVASADDKIAYLGGAGDENASAMTIANGKVWIAGSSTADMDGLPKIGKTDGFLTRLDIDTGQKEWARRFTAKDGSAIPTSINVASGSASVLDRLGLPSGALSYTDSTLLTSATSVRAGDSFRIRVTEGAKPSTITIDPAETLETLSAKVKKITGTAAKLEIITENNQSRFRISPAADGKSIEILSGPMGQDALESLGMSAGMMRTTKYEQTVRQYSIGLNMDKELKLDTPEAIQATLDVLNGASVALRNAYRTIATNLDPVEKARAQSKAATSGKSGGSVPGYLNNQIANYQAGLSRLTGGY